MMSEYSDNVHPDNTIVSSLTKQLAAYITAVQTWVCMNLNTLYYIAYTVLNYWSEVDKILKIDKLLTNIPWIK